MCQRLMRHCYCCRKAISQTGSSSALSLTLQEVHQEACVGVEAELGSCRDDKRGSKQTEVREKRSVQQHIIKLWNSLPQDVKMASKGD